MPFRCRDEKSRWCRYRMLIMQICNGTLRDTCVYSIIDQEWPTVKANLVYRLDATR